MVQREIKETMICDICKQPMTENYGSYNRLKIQVPTVIGPQNAQISVNILDFSKYGKTIHQPDLCCNCVRKILMDFVNNLPIQPTVTKE